jgi:eukaryotic-like serine/threonine-protein kinase
VMGTPGYMSPEQTRGDEVGPPTDVYALGAILFEILARERAGAATLAGGRISPADVAPDRGIPPELDQLCSEAMSDEPGQRPSARTLAMRVQRYLDGDRDLERRRTLAMELVATARVDLASKDPARRGSAIKSAGRALALDPENESAAAIVAKLMIEPPPVMPPELAQRLADIDLEQGRSQGKRAIGSLCAYFLFLPISVWMGVRDVGMVVLLYALIAATIAFAVIRLRHPQLPMTVALVLNACMLLALSRVTSPFLIVPTLAVGIGILFAMFPQLLRVPWMVLGASVSALVLPMVFEAAGWWRETWKLQDGHFVADPSVVTFDGTAGKVFLIGITVATAIVFPLFVRALAIAQRASRRQLEVQAWHLQHLIPKV